MTARKSRFLRDGEWLNDDLIGAGMAMIQTRHDRLALLRQNLGAPVQRSSRFYNSQFMCCLLQQQSSSPGEYSFLGVQRWTRRFDIFDLDRIYLPLNVGNQHWTMIVVHVQRRRIEYFNSLCARGRSYMKHVLHWLKDETTDKQKRPCHYQ
ncbi:hypothetical protein B484DRAFT_339727 [Ochromonadaceae sp. CCMP2298]|nr:hypothetical protein B484DRAFT_339727 [Ochromonadaceae sp. CCMP2298]